MIARKLALVVQKLSYRVLRDGSGTPCMRLSVVTRGVVFISRIFGRRGHPVIQQNNEQLTLRHCLAVGTGARLVQWPYSPTIPTIY